MNNDLQQAIAFIKSGDKKRGGQLLAEIVKKNPRNIDAWLWLTSCVNSNEQRIYCLKKILEIDPNHKIAISALAKLEHPEQPSVAEILGTNKPNSEVTNKSQAKQQGRKASKESSHPREIHTFGKISIIIGLVFTLLICVAGAFVYSNLNNSQQQPTINQPPTITPVPRIRSSDLSSICLRSSELPIGYTASETINNINETKHDDKYKSGIEGYYETTLKALGYPTITCQLFLYPTVSMASSIFQDMATTVSNGPLRERYSLQEYGDDRIGVVVLLNSPFYVYEFRKGRVIAEIYLISDHALEYSFIDGVVSLVDSKLSLFDTR